MLYVDRQHEITSNKETGGGDIGDSQSSLVCPETSAAGFEEMAKPYRTQFLDWHDTRRQPKTDNYCVVCQKDIKSEPRFWIHGVDGCAFNVLHPDDEHLYVSDGGDLGLHPVGPDCARRIGLRWVHRAAAKGA